jgi:hypothetical protein
MAELMNVSRAQLDRILDADDAGLSMEMLCRACHAVGYRVSLQLVAA